ncbi:hypothetical protein GPECTOR_10g763 [Gonium pectorale]|uniref:Uncharacterized protein n=1 Tax=Gonium pectorale TaxID=33097 RepID=A0A150GQR5_GONPE|nr:hypothetical protein GPECTOR_10g763 [Gonium pectorale]|eukprot:KXZ52134.1 hypothetical protein GPECTOR_10g763 [Gonium pectorale]
MVNAQIAAVPAEGHESQRRASAGPPPCREDALRRRIHAVAMTLGADLSPVELQAVKQLAMRMLQQAGQGQGQPPGAQGAADGGGAGQGAGVDEAAGKGQVEVPKPSNGPDLEQRGYLAFGSGVLVGAVLTVGVLLVGGASAVRRLLPKSPP